MVAVAVADAFQGCRCDATRQYSRTDMDTSAHTHCPVRSLPLPSMSLACPVLCRQRSSCTLPVLCLSVGLINFASRLSGFNVSDGLDPIRNRNLLSVRLSAPMPNPSDPVPASARLSTLTAGIFGIPAVDSIPFLGSCFFDRPCLVRPNAHWALVGVYHRPTATSRHGFPLRHAAQAPQTMTCSSTLASVEARLKKSSYSKRQLYVESNYTMPRMGIINRPRTSFAKRATRLPPCSLLREHVPKFDSPASTW